MKDSFKKRLIYICQREMERGGGEGWREKQNIMNCWCREINNSHEMNMSVKMNDSTQSREHESGRRPDVTLIHTSLLWRDFWPLFWKYYKTDRKPLDLDEAVFDMGHQLLTWTSSRHGLSLTQHHTTSAGVKKHFIITLSTLVIWYITLHIHTALNSC